LFTPGPQNWLHKLIGYDFTLKYKPRKENVTLDSLSRSFMALSHPKIWVASKKLREVIAYNYATLFVEQAS